VYRQVSGTPRHRFATTKQDHRAARSRDVRLSVLSLALAVIAMLVWAADTSAQGLPEEAARDTAQQLVGRLRGKLAGGSVGEPVLVHSFEERTPQYYIVPVQKHGRTVGLIGVSKDGTSWQWYTQGYKQERFPAVDKARADQMLAARGRGPAIVVAGPDRALYWTSSTGDGGLLSLDDATAMRSARQVSAAAAPDVRPGANLLAESTAPTGGSTAVTTSATLPASKNLTVPHYYQINSYYCGPAALQMIFDLYNPPIGSQEDIAAVMNAKDWGTWRGAYADDLLRTARFSSLSAAVRNPSLVGFQERALGYGATSNMWSYEGTADPEYATRYADLKGLIASGSAVTMLTWYDANHRIGHFRILKGYDDSTDEFIVNDPWYSAPYYGPDVHFKQSFLVDDLWTKYYRWAAVVRPWTVSVSAPSTVSAGAPFTVSATVRYPGPLRMAGRSPVADSQATITLPAGFTVSAPAQSLPSVTSSGTAQTVSWAVTPPATFSGNATIRVVGRGKYSGASTSYPSYSDWIGGSGLKPVSVQAQAGDDQPPSTVSLTPTSVSSAPGEWRTLTATYTDANGPSDLLRARLLVSATTGTGRALYAGYNTATGLLYLRNADNTDWLPGAAPGSAAILDNGYGRVDASRTTITSSGQNLVVSWMVSQSEPTSAAPRNVYLQAEDQSGLLSAWKQYGTWLVPEPRVASHGTSSNVVESPEKPVAISSTFTDARGWADLQTVQVLINKELRGTGAVWLRYDPAKKALYLRSADNSSWLGPIVPGGTGSLDNGRARLLGSATTVSGSGETLRVRWGVIFHQPFSGSRYTLYDVAVAGGGSLSALPWERHGSYTVSASPIALQLAPSSERSLPSATVSHPATYRDPDGAGGISRVQLLVNSQISGAQAVLVAYDNAANKLYLRNDAGSGWLGGVAPGTAATVQNAQVVLRADRTTVSRSGTDLTVNWSLTYKPSYSGKRYNVYGHAGDALGAPAAWRMTGDWIVNRPPAAVSLSPKSSSSAAGSLVSFAATYADMDGVNTMNRATFIINSVAGGSGGLMVRYDLATNKLWMRKNDLSGWTGGLAPGTAGKLSTAYASLDTGRTSVTREGNSLTVRWAVSLGSGMRNRSLHQYMAARDSVGGTSGNVSVGSWTVR